MSLEVPDTGLPSPDTQDEGRAPQERETLLRNELAHRVRNILAVTRSIFSRTVDHGSSAEEAIEHFRGRLDALARYHGRSAGVADEGFDLESMVEDEFLVFAAHRDGRIAMSGPDVRLRRGVAESFGIALHELATNSVKFGVLGNEGGRGRLAVTWHRAGDTLSFTWVETDIAIMASAPIPSGFGRYFIEQALPYQLDADTRFEFAPGELRCTIVVPRAVLASGA